MFTVLWVKMINLEEIICVCTTIPLLLAGCGGFQNRNLEFTTLHPMSIATPVDGATFDEGTVIVFEALIGDDFDAPETLGLLVERH